MFKRIFLIVLDSVGCGAAPDAEKFGDEGSNTLFHIAENVDNFSLPNLSKLGLGEILQVKNIRQPDKVIGIYGKMQEKSKGKDTTDGHWEMSGDILYQALPTFPNGFPKELMDKFMQVTGVKGYLGNKVASGTQIIMELGEEHLKTRFPIVYTSADSVFQIAAHEAIFPIEQQYEICEKTRALLTGKYRLGRVIARPFIGKPGNFTRTERRRDYSLMPPDGILTDVVSKAGKQVIGIGKIEDIFNHKGLTQSFHTENSTTGIAKIKELIEQDNFSGLVFANLVDFDMLYGHRRDVAGYYHALVQFDKALGEYLPLLKDTDALFITADHGNDPTFKGTDHTREYVPVLGYSKQFKQSVNIGIRQTFADLGQTIAEMLNTNELHAGKSFLRLIL